MGEVPNSFFFFGRAWEVCFRDLGVVLREVVAREAERARPDLRGIERENVTTLAPIARGSIAL